MLTLPLLPFSSWHVSTGLTYLTFEYLRLHLYLNPCYMQVVVRPLTYSNPLAYNTLGFRKTRNMKLQFNCQVSENAYVSWDVGPNHTVTYTKPADATETWLMGQPFREATGMPTEDHKCSYPALHRATRRVPSWLHIWSLLCSPSHICTLAGSKMQETKHLQEKNIRKLCWDMVLVGHLPHTLGFGTMHQSTVSTSRQGNTLVTNLQSYQAWVCWRVQTAQCYFSAEVARSFTISNRV